MWEWIRGNKVELSDGEENDGDGGDSGDGNDDIMMMIIVYVIFWLLNGIRFNEFRLWLIILLIVESGFMYRYNINDNFGRLF